jgi:hypothetical protein
MALVIAVLPVAKSAIAPQVVVLHVFMLRDIEVAVGDPRSL